MSEDGGRRVAIAQPSFPIRESHAHVYQLGRSLGMIEFSACGSAAEVLEAFAMRLAQQRQDGEVTVLLGQGARPESWEPRAWPTLDELDRVTGKIPALAWCFDYHALLANSAMLKLAGFGRSTPDPPGGMLERDSAGHPTGLVFEAAALAVWHAVPEPSPAQRNRDVREGLQQLAGFAEVHDLKSQPWLGPVVAARFAEQADTEAMPERCVLYPLLEDLDEVLATRKAWEHDRVRLGGAKVFVDGTLNSRTAWMLEPFADGRPEHPRGTPMMMPSEIEEAVRQCDAAGLPMAAHAIGDAAVRAVLDAIEKVQPTTPGFRIEHAEIIDEADVPRFAELGVIASVQPCHLLSDIEVLRTALPHCLSRVLPLRELIEAGCVPGESLVFGSDVPIVRADPEDSILAATTRRRTDMPKREALAPEQALTQEEAWEAFRIAGT
ncbi:hypothetical protein MNBD_PLANCTO03-781 [hydrothermal vent metagenome]|uniref:Amidohydrolase 3 domain-containing protein n=1 Tax=hydrothermal vent metagenome TaxID=652676 RepID=A0A3B1DVW3_9ZZZZ